MVGTYERQWGSPHPGCIIILLDQSGSMDDPIAPSKIGAGRRKCDMVATILNNFLNGFIGENTITNKDGVTKVKPRADIAILGYEGSTVRSALTGALGNKDFVTLPELQMDPIEIEKRKMKQVDDTGQIFEVPILFPIWVKPTVGGGTPMCAALKRAKELVEQWIQGHPDNYPSVVINVTDGMSTDGDPVGIAQELCQLATSDGQVLLYNVHLTHLSEEMKEFPTNESELPDDKYARQLFTISSVIPQTSIDLLNLTKDPTIPDFSFGARGMIFNGDAESVQKMFNLGTAVSSQSSMLAQVLPLDPNR